MKSIDWKDFIYLQDKEYIIKHWGVKDGVLILTSMRIVHMKADRSNHYEKFNLNESIPLTSIKSVNGSGDIWRQDVYIYTNEKKITFIGIYPKEGIVEGKMPRIDFKDMVMEQIKSTIQNENKVTIDYSFLKTYLDKGGILLTTLRCPHCGAPIEIPNGGNNVKCKHCGNLILAIDLLDRISRITK